MAKMSKYCKAYELRDLRAYPRWAERDVQPALVAGDNGEANAPLNDESVVFIHDNYTVTGGVVLEEEIIFDTVDDEWKTFCHERLEFAIPEDVEPAA